MERATFQSPTMFGLWNRVVIFTLLRLRTRKGESAVPDTRKEKQEAKCPGNPRLYNPQRTRQHEHTVLLFWNPQTRVVISLLHEGGRPRELLIHTDGAFGSECRAQGRLLGGDGTIAYQVLRDQRAGLEQKRRALAMSRDAHGLPCQCKRHKRCGF